VEGIGRRLAGGWVLLVGRQQKGREGVRELRESEERGVGEK